MSTENRLTNEQIAEREKFLRYPYDPMAGNVEDEIDHAKRQIYKEGILKGLTLRPLSTPSEEKWISVKENGLPEKYGYYNVCYENPSSDLRGRYVITICFSRDKWYYDNSECEPAENETLKVTHWMPLPSPPTA